MKKTKLSLMLLFAVSLAMLPGCKDDEVPAALEIVTITATGTDLATGNQVTVDLNGTATATDVPPDAPITITFSKDVDATTASATSITLTAGTASVTATVAASGSTVTVTPDGDLERGTDYTLSVAATVIAIDGGIFTAASRTFTTAGRAPAIIPQESSLILYLPFESEVVDELGHVVLVSDVGFAADRFGNFEASADFNGTTNYVGVEYAADLVTASQTISYWIKVPASSDYDAHVRTSGYITYSFAGNQGSFHEWGRFDCCGFTFDFFKDMTNHINTGTNGGYIGRWDESKQEGAVAGGDLTFDNDNKAWLEDNTGKWLHIVTTYDAAQSKKAIYTNGVLATEFVYAAAGDGTSATGDWAIDLVAAEADANNNSNLYLGAGLPWWGLIDDIKADGFSIIPDRGGAHAFLGQMDDFRMFSVALTDAEVAALYNAEKP